MEKKNKAGDVTIPDFKLHYDVVVIKTVQCWLKNRLHNFKVLLTYSKHSEVCSLVWALAFGEGENNIVGLLLVDAER